MRKTWQNTSQVYFNYPVILSDKGQTQKLTKAQIEKNKQAILLRALANKNGISADSSGSEEEKDSDGEEKFNVAPNLNHVQRDQQEEDEKFFDEVINGKLFVF
jgi:hypothetical protein